MMSDAELEETKVLFIGAWDVLGRRGPRLLGEIKALKAELLDAYHDHALTWELLNRSMDREQALLDREAKRLGVGPLVCHFCGDADFDLVGLKRHLGRGWCQVYEATDPPKDQHVERE